ncbi:MAG: hypothetical protein D6773_03150 [Alphaproteobacteria bacterium]|nr:MAG: hypothetical protein D6773_03150 [Alphaproteobacteria bacterium]
MWRMTLILIVLGLAFGSSAGVGDGGLDSEHAACAAKAGPVTKGVTGTLDYATLTCEGTPTNCNGRFIGSSTGGWS